MKKLLIIWIVLCSALSYGQIDTVDWGVSDFDIPSRAGEADFVRSGAAMINKAVRGEFAGDVTISASYAGLLGTKVTNTYTDAIPVAGAVHQMTNDNGYWGLVGVTNSGSTIGAGLFVNTFHVYNQGYGNTLFTIDGNKSFVWYSDTTDSHNFSALSNPIMTLNPDGGLDTDSIATDAITYTDTYWDDLRVPLTNTRINPINSEPDFEDRSDGLFAWGFDPDSDSAYVLNFITQTPHKRKSGTAIEAHIHWGPNTTNTGSVKWRLIYSTSSINGTFSTPDTLWVTDAADGTSLKHQLADFGNLVDSDQLGISSIIIGSIARIGEDAEDTYTGSAYGYELDFHYEIDSPGSEEENIKY